MGVGCSAMNDNELDLEWMNEKVQSIKGHKFLYNFFCFVTFRMRRKLKYKELFLIYYGIHRKKLGEIDSKKKAIETVIKIYEENNGKKPVKLWEK